MLLKLCLSHKTQYTWAPDGLFRENSILGDFPAGSKHVLIWNWNYYFLGKLWHLENGLQQTILWHHTAIMVHWAAKWRHKCLLTELNHRPRLKQKQFSGNKVLVFHNAPYWYVRYSVKLFLQNLTIKGYVVISIMHVIFVYWQNLAEIRIFPLNGTTKGTCPYPSSNA